jgi:Heterokaryon incompatibility protein (HET)
VNLAVNVITMRLLVDRGDGNLNLEEYDDNNIPHYAILSHTWGADGEEVIFKDLMEDTGKDKAGYKKIKFCRNKAASDSLQHFWVDTCCIDKSSSAELTEAINSMYRWYQHADKCYVYLSDVSSSGDATNANSSTTTWEAAFRRSRWFRRGWTLQELIAPASVEFFSQEGDRLGDKRSLEQTILEITEIPVKALRGAPLADFEVEERMSWASHRDTKKQEDGAYSLLGLFDIHMPLIYGEGGEKAFVRLREEISKSSKRK